MLILLTINFCDSFSWQKQDYNQIRTNALGQKLWWNGLTRLTRIKTRWKCFGETRSTQYELSWGGGTSLEVIQLEVISLCSKVRRGEFDVQGVRRAYIWIWTHFALTVKKNKQLSLVFTLSICQPCQVYLINWPTCLHELLVIINHFSLTPLSRVTLIFGAVIFLFKLSGIM